MRATFWPYVVHVLCRLNEENHSVILFCLFVGFEVPNLIHPLRNSGNILGFAQIVKTTTEGDTRSSHILSNVYQLIYS